MAGVGRLVVSVPPDRDTGGVSPVTLAAAAVAGVDELHAVGGAQAIAALAYGASDVPPCDVVVGPGNRFVAEAKNGESTWDVYVGQTPFVEMSAMIEADVIEQLAEAQPALTALSEDPSLRDHWHSAYGVYVCTDDEFLEPFLSENDPDGIHSHQDGLIHIHPFGSSVTGDDAQMDVFLSAMNVSLDDNQMILADGTVLEPVDVGEVTAAARTLLERGARLMQEGRVHSARRAFDLAVRRQPGSDEARVAAAVLGGSAWPGWRVSPESAARSRGAPPLSSPTAPKGPRRRTYRRSTGKGRG